MLCVVGGSATGRFLNKSVKQDEEILTLAAAGGCDGVVYGRHSPSSWNCRNDVVFNKVGNTNFLQVFIKATTSGNRGFGLALPSRFPYGPVPIVALVPVIGPRAPARTSPAS